MSQLKVSLKGDLTLKRQLAALTMPPRRRKQFHRKFGREVQKQSKRRIREQRDVHGQRFKGRKTGSGKVLRRMMRGRSGEQTNVYAGANKAVVTWRNSLTGKIARAHQEGFNETLTGKDMERRHGTPDYSAPATHRQARALIQAGYKLPQAGKYASGKKKGQQRSKRVSIAWIKENMTLGQAGMILRLLEERQAADSWEIELPARSFFGLSRNEQAQLANKLIDELTSGVKRAR